jgi:hypothetical protein
VTFATPSDDRWHYPFSSGGQRPVASCFGSLSNPGFIFNDRDAELVIAWSTPGQIASGQGAAAYGIRSVRVTLTNEAGATWPIDLTPDDWFTYDVNQDGIINADGVPRGQPGDTDGESSDPDDGRAIELFGAGFGPFFTLQTWNENSPYVGSANDANTPRDPFPFVYLNAGADLLHVEDNVKGLFNEAYGVFQFTPQPWAVGAPSGYSPGQQAAPFDITCEFNLDLSGGRVRRYFQEQLNAGRVAIIATSLRETVFMGGSAGFPSIFNKEAVGLTPGAKAPRLDLDLCVPLAADFDADCDVDGADVDAMAGCRTGPGVGPPANGCDAKDLDDDQDVDQDDFGILQRCYSGAGHDPSPACGS